MDHYDTPEFVGLESLDLDDPQLKKDLAALYGNTRGFMLGKHHARHIDPDTCYHIITRAFQGRFLLRPTVMLMAIILAVLGRALCHNYQGVQLFADAWLSNHLHLMLRGPPDQVIRFMGFIKKMVSLRWGRKIGWSKAMWDKSFIATALPTAASQERCLKYILGQGVKEDLVERPQNWPGVHCAKYLLSHAPYTMPRECIWFDATTYGRLKDANKRLKHPKKVDKAPHYKNYTLTYARIPAWEGLTEEECIARLQRMGREVVEEGRARRKKTGKKVMGRKKIQAMPLDTISELPPQPYWTHRRRMICWAHPCDPEVQAYNSKYWDFQTKFRIAADKYIKGEPHEPFPDGAFIPGRYKPPASEPALNPT